MDGRFGDVLAKELESGYRHACILVRVLKCSRQSLRNGRRLAAMDEDPVRKLGDVVAARTD